MTEPTPEQIGIVMKLLKETEDDCPECGGSGGVAVFDMNIGEVFPKKCWVCKGTGKVLHPERLDNAQKVIDWIDTHKTVHYVRDVYADFNHDAWEEFKAGFRKKVLGY